jgi:DNA repair exonuclease SbcCD ATPase subunit
MANMLSKYQSILHKTLGKMDLLEKTAVTTRSKIADLRELLKAQEEAQAIIQQVSKDTQDQICFRIEDLVQNALDAIFPDKYKFKMEFEMKRGKTETRIFLESGGLQISPMDSNGGGVVDVISFALRIAAWAISKNRPTILLDEPFKFLSANLRPLLGELIQGISATLGIQIIMVTHDEEMISAADRIFRVGQTDGRSYAEMIKE